MITDKISLLCSAMQKCIIMMRFDMLRVFDILLAIVIGIVTLPIQVFVLALVWLAYGRNPIFVQERVGLYGKLFWLYKIKTMRDSAVDDDSKRVTLIGRYLRRSSIDELPQILNVLLGDMSFVGPRPLTREILDNIQVFPPSPFDIGIRFS